MKKTHRRDLFNSQLLAPVRIQTWALHFVKTDWHHMKRDLCHMKREPQKRPTLQPAAGLCRNLDIRAAFCEKRLTSYEKRPMSYEKRPTKETCGTASCSSMSEFRRTHCILWKETYIIWKETYVTWKKSHIRDLRDNQLLAWVGI